MKIKEESTARGFTLITFVDRYGVKCNIQQSSLATEDAIWLGAEEIGLKEMYSNGGWKDVDTKGDEHTSYIANNRMHLTRKQVKKLLPILKHFAKTGDLKLTK